MEIDQIYFGGPRLQKLKAVTKGCSLRKIASLLLIILFNYSVVVYITYIAVSSLALMLWVGH